MVRSFLPLEITWPVQPNIVHKSGGLINKLWHHITTSISITVSTPFCHPVYFSITFCTQLVFHSNYSFSECFPISKFPGHVYQLEIWVHYALEYKWFQNLYPTSLPIANIAIPAAGPQCSSLSNKHNKIYNNILQYYRTEHWILLTDNTVVTLCCGFLLLYDVVYYLYIFEFLMTVVRESCQTGQFNSFLARKHQIIDPCSVYEKCIYSH